MKTIKTEQTLSTFGEKGFVYAKVAGTFYQTELTPEQHSLKIKLPQLLSNKHTPEHKHIIILPRTWPNKSESVSLPGGKLALPDNKEFVQWLQIMSTYQQILDRKVYLPWTYRFQDLGSAKTNAILNHEVYAVKGKNTLQADIYDMMQTEFTWYVRFNYSKPLVDAIKAHGRGRRWHPERTLWSVEAINVKEITHLVTLLLNTRVDTVQFNSMYLDSCKLEFSQDTLIWHSWTAFNPDAKGSISWKLKFWTE